MKILMIAPEPFFEPRGTPLSEYFRIQALCRLGHSVDLVTYPIGEDRQIPGLTIFRCWKPPFVRGVRTGPSFTKLILDVFLFFKAWARIRRGDYDVIHTHEEANIMGVFLGRRANIPHLYDMHSSLVQQMSNFQFTRLRIVVGFFRWMERLVLTRATSVIVICQSLYDYAMPISGGEKLTLIENFMDDIPNSLDPVKLVSFRRTWCRRSRKIVTYTGTLEPYQGMSLLIDSFVHLPDSFHLLVIGGKDKQVQSLSHRISRLGLNGRIHILGSRSPEEIPYFLEISDVLVSPRTLGTNIPLKIYAYLKSGVPVVATDLYTHTQTLTDDIAILVDPQPRALAEGIKRAAGEEGRRVAKGSRDFCRKNFSDERYLELVNSAIEVAVAGTGSQD